MEKRKRGKRGGSKNKSIQDEVEVFINEHQEESVQTHKKTRRGNRGKSHPVDHFEMQEQDDQQDFPSTEVDSRQPFPVLDTETRQYFENIEKVITSQEQEEQVDEEERQLLLNNIFKEIDGKEMMIIADYETSRILEKILSLSTDFHIRVFMDRLRGKFIDLIFDQFASHVCQKLLLILADISERELLGQSFVELEDQDATLLTAHELVLDFCQELKESWSALMTDNYGSHILRAILTILSGSEAVMDSSISKSKKSRQYASHHKLNLSSSTNKMSKPRQVSDDFLAAFEEIVDILQASLNGKSLQQLSIHPVANPVIQLLVTFKSHNQKILKSFLSKENIMFLKHLIPDSVGSHLMEKMLQQMDDKSYSSVYSEFFKDKLVEMTEHPIANFVVQSLIISCKQESILEEILQELSSSFEELAFQNRLGVVTKLAESMIAFYKLQKPFLDSLISAYRIDLKDKKQRKEFAQAILYKKSYSEYSIGRPVGLQESLLIQHMIQFQESENGLVIESVKSLSQEEALAWIKDSSLSRILEAFLTSDSVTSKRKDKFISSLLGTFGKLACDKYASHFIDKCWKVIHISVKEKIAMELVAVEKDLKENFYGKFVLRNCKIELFKRRKEDWKQLEQGVEKKKKMFAEFFN